MKRVLVVGVILSSCAAQPSGEDRFVATPPDRASFPPVADLLEHRCGSLDCEEVQRR